MMVKINLLLISGAHLKNGWQDKINRKTANFKKIKRKNLYYNRYLRSNSQPPTRLRENKAAACDMGSNAGR